MRPLSEITAQRIAGIADGIVEARFRDHRVMSDVGSWSIKTYMMAHARAPSRFSWPIYSVSQKK